MEIDIKNIVEIIETPLLFIDDNYIIQYHNKASKKLILNNLSFLDILNKVYCPLFINGIKNRFPFTLTEKRLLKKRLLLTTEESYKLTVKPLSENLFLVEFTKVSSMTKTNSMLIKKNREFIKHSGILSDLIKIKSGKESIDNINSDEIIKLYEEQLKLQFAIDDAVNKTIAPIVDGNFTISQAANLILTEIKSIINCSKGLIISKKDDGYNIIEKFDDKGSLNAISDINEFLVNITLIDKPIYYNDLSTLKKYSELTSIVNDFSNIMIIPLKVESINYGYMILANCNDSFNDMHLKIAIRLGQLFSLAIQRSEYLELLHDQANNDILTGCFNRRYGMLMLEKIYSDAKNTSRPFSVMFFDINNLKKVNDVLGHDHGDDLIKSFADITKNIIRENEVFSRYGGDEFVLIVPNCKIAIANKIERRIKDAIDSFNKTSNKPFELSVSIGSVEHNKDSNLSIDELVSQADAIMYENKERYKKERKQK